MPPTLNFFLLSNARLNLHNYYYTPAFSKRIRIWTQEWILHHRSLSRRLDRCDRVIQNESGDSNGPAFALTPFLGDNTQFFKNGRRFSNLSASCGRSFCGSSNRLVDLL